MGTEGQEKTRDSGDYRAFIFAVHPSHGVLLLYCTRKVKKGPHHQVPGGHVDEEDHDAADNIFKTLADITETETDTIFVACKIGAARELYEETGIDIRNDLDRLNPVRLRVETLPMESGTQNKINCELKKRLFFSVQVTDEDFWTKDNCDEGTIKKLGLASAMNKELSHLMLKLSAEHQGFCFESDPLRAAQRLMHHSGGKITKALQMSTQLGGLDGLANGVTGVEGPV